MPYANRYLTHLALTAVMALGALVGCTKDFTTQADALREKNLELEKQVETLTVQNAEQERTIESLRQQVAELRGVPSEIDPARLPAPSKIEVQRFSAAVDKDRDGTPDLLRIYVGMSDQRGRFIPTLARAHVQAVSLKEGREPLVVAEQTFDIEAFEDAYRGGSLTGPHYTFDVKLPTPIPEGVREVTVLVTVTPATTGRPLKAQQVIDLFKGQDL